MTTIALITGANKGIGFETAGRLAATGTTVLVGARDADRGKNAAAALSGAGADTRFIPLDVTDADSIARAAADIDAEFGKLDILVNNAGIAGRLDGDGKPSSTALSTLREVFETNVFGIVALTNAVLPLLRRSEAARIVNVSSEVGSFAMTMDEDSPMWPMAAIAYPTSKTALTMVTAMYAKELWNTPIKVNAANPGYCATDLNANTGFRTAAQGAEVVARLATLPVDGPTGTLWGYRWGATGADEYGVLPW
ncbi:MULTISPECIES: SDR family NAD(P)-dependent oxidoreductase [Nocardia]|uniref:SDR family NAD(P)-dependent oxidoreductase n=1 Tax=Nocardia TaxID=1817 RepID=UPI000D6A02FD|nr:MULTISPECIES: SDR family NAD(P)-dependent oxidoreductase [Nocardia]